MSTKAKIEILAIISSTAALLQRMAEQETARIISDSWDYTAKDKEFYELNVNNIKAESYDKIAELSSGL